MKQFCRIALMLGISTAAGLCGKFYEDDPLPEAPPPRSVEKAAVRKLSDYYDILWHTLATPGDRQRPDKPIPAQGINTLGEPLESAWWEPRHYWQALSIENLKAGPGSGSAPAGGDKWTVVSAKTEGITPGFVVHDRQGHRYFVKFDPLSNPEMATGADQIASKIFHALGYHVPENYLVFFRPDVLELGRDVQVVDQLGHQRKMTGRDLSEILQRVYRAKDGRFRATASLLVPGKSIGPYRYSGTRSDDPNDVVPHEYRRDLRGMHLACAWVDHDDSRSINTLDVLTGAPGSQYIKHYQLDFGSTLGSGSDKVNSPRSGGEYLFDWKPAALQLATLGLAVPKWARARYPDLPAVGLFESELFDPERWVPEYPNPAFRNRLPDDEFWMARQIAALRDEDVRAIVATAQYSDPRASEWVLKCLIERRDKIARAAFAKVLPLDRFELRDGSLGWKDVAAQYGLGQAMNITVQWAVFDNERETGVPIAGEASARLPSMESDGYWLATLACAQRPGQTVRVYVRKRGARVEVVGVERTW